MWFCPPHADSASNQRVRFSCLKSWLIMNRSSGCVQIFTSKLFLDSLTVGVSDLACVTYEIAVIYSCRMAAFICSKVSCRTRAQTREDARRQLRYRYSRRAHNQHQHTPSHTVPGTVLSGHERKYSTDTMPKIQTSTSQLTTPPPS
jgi:hypothetical protein